jgi:hypothetical protein
MSKANVNVSRVYLNPRGKQGGEWRAKVKVKGDIDVAVPPVCGDGNLESAALDRALSRYAAREACIRDACGALLEDLLRKEREEQIAALKEYDERAARVDAPAADAEPETLDNYESERIK